MGKRYIRVDKEGVASTTSKPGTRSSLADISAMLTSIEVEEEDCARVVYSMGDLPSSFKTAMESIDASKGKEACDSEFESLRNNGT